MDRRQIAGGQEPGVTGADHVGLGHVGAGAVDVAGVVVGDELEDDVGRRDRLAVGVDVEGPFWMRVHPLAPASQS